LSNTEVEQRLMPVQARSQQRVESILDAAINVIEDIGVVSATTSEIARRAGISLASLYRYFPNKEAIIKRIAVFHLEKQKAFTQGFIGDFNLIEGLDLLIDCFAEFYRSEPAYIEVWSGIEGFPELAALELEDLENNAEMLSAKAAQEIPHINKKELKIIARTLSRAIGQNLRLAMTMSRKDANDTIAEVKFMAHAYLQARLGSPPTTD